MTKQAPTTTVHAWYLEFTEGTSNKFYRVYVTENRITTLNWGRIGSAGQNSVTVHDSYDKARDVGLRQVFEKKAKGYFEVHHDLKFEASAEAIEQARDGVLWRLDAEFDEAAAKGQFEAAKGEVLRIYDEFAERVKVLLDRAESADLEELLDEYESVSSVWEEIGDRHAEVNAALDLCKQTLMTKLVSS